MVTTTLTRTDGPGTDAIEGTPAAAAARPRYQATDLRQLHDPSSATSPCPLRTKSPPDVHKAVLTRPIHSVPIPGMLTDVQVTAQLA